MTGHPHVSGEPDPEEADVELIDAVKLPGAGGGGPEASAARDRVQDGGEQRAGDYLIGYGVEQAEGTYELLDGELRWQGPGACNVRLEVSVRNAKDGRLVPGLSVQATLLDGKGREVASHAQPFIWHPTSSHYGRDWSLPGAGEYRLRLRVAPVRAAGDDEAGPPLPDEPVEVEFEGVRIPGR